MDLIIEAYNSRDEQQYIHIPSAIYTDSNLAYNKVYMDGWNYEDLSFSAIKDGVFKAGMIIYAGVGPDGKKELSACGYPVVYFGPNKDNQLVRTAVTKKLKKILDCHKGSHLRFCEKYSNSLSAPAKLLMDNGSNFSTAFTVVVDISQPLEKLKAQIRKSYKSLINFGMNNFETEILDSQSIKQEHINIFRELHFNAAGRETRVPATWDLQYQAILQKEGFLVLTKWNGEYIGAAYFIMNNKMCYYGAAAYRRDLFDKPIAHSSLWNAILFSKELGCTEFESGACFFNGQKSSAISDKERQIGVFKRGFGGEIRLTLDIDYTC